MPPDLDYLHLLRLDGQGFVCLGSGAGIGGQTCRALAQAGANVLCVDLDPEAAAAAAAACGGTWLSADIASRDDMERVFSTASEQFGDRFAGIVDVVGVPIPGDLVRHDDQEIEQQFDLVLRHALLTVQIGGPKLAARGGGSIIFVAALAGRQVSPTVMLYGVAKAGLMALVQAAAHRLGPDQVRVNAVAPGRIAGSGRVRPHADQIARISAPIPLGRLGQPPEIAAPILFFASQMSSYITGQVLVADGGISNLTALPST